MDWLTKSDIEFFRQENYQESTQDQINVNSDSIEEEYTSNSDKASSMDNKQVVFNIQPGEIANQYPFSRGASDLLEKGSDEVSQSSNANNQARKENSTNV